MKAVNQRKICRKISSNWRIVFILVFITLMVLTIGKMYSSRSERVYNGRADLRGIHFNQNELVQLNGNWEFYWNRLLTPQDFVAKQLPQMDSFMKVPDTWDVQVSGRKAYPYLGVATYRLQLNYPSTLKDPALRIQNVATAYKLYANGRLIAEVGKVSDKPSSSKDGDRLLIVELPNDTQKQELIFQVTNLNYARGGIRESPVFGSKQALESQRMIRLAIQLFFIGSVSIFSVYYFLLFVLQKSNKTALLFSILCFIVALRSLMWGESPLYIYFPNITYDGSAYINYFTGYNLMPVIILFVLSIYPLEYKKTIFVIALLPSLFFNVLLLLASPAVMSLFTNYLYRVVILQMIYIISILIKAVLRKRENATLMFSAVCIFILTIILDILYYKGIVGTNVAYMFLYGSFFLIAAMSFVQAILQSNTHKKLILYNENLVEADRLKNKIMATEMSFLQAQIKPHFLYNALNAIANICEKDGKKAANLILDLAIYLRGNLEFNHLDKMSTIEKELEFISTYFNIEQARFGQKIQLLKEIESPLDYRIPVLILQPLVENAVRHGISKKLGGGTVWVRIKQTNEGCFFEIEDNGVGIEREKLERLLSETEIDPSVGLKNIHYRLLRLYGRGIDISSEVGRGTCVRLVIPEGRKQL